MAEPRPRRAVLHRLRVPDDMRAAVTTAERNAGVLEWHGLGGKVVK